MPSVRVADTDIFYDEYGSGDEVLVLVHGYLGSAEIWSPLAEDLDDRFHCIAIDARGVGRSGRPADGYSVPQWTRDVLGVADALGLPPFTYVGHSMGCLPGYELALTRPDRITNLILVCPSPAGPPRAGTQAFAPFRDAWAQQDAAALAALLASTSVRLPDPGMTARRGETAALAGAGHLDALLENASAYDARTSLADLTTPTLMVVGSAEPALVACLNDYQLLPNATLEVRYGVGHVPQLEATSQVAGLVRTFLDEGLLTFAGLRARSAA